jgi:hypothetical protein
VGLGGIKKRSLGELLEKVFLIKSLNFNLGAVLEERCSNDLSKK